MRRARVVLLQALRLRPLWLLVLVPACVAALITTFWGGHQHSVWVYMVYAISAYTLVVLVFALPGLIKNAKILLYKNEYSNRYLSEIPYRTRISLRFSLAGNLLFALFKFACGLLYSSLWFGAVAVYYALLCVVRFVLLRFVHQNMDGTPDAYRKYRSCGRLLLVLTLPLASMVAQMVYSGARYHYPGLIIYAVAAYAFTSLTAAVVGLVRYRRLDSPLHAAAKTISLVSALVAMLTLQTAMFSSFGGNESLERLMNALTGGAVCLVILAMALYMITKANRKLRTLRQSPQP